MYRLYSLQAVHTVKYSVQQSWLFLSKFKFMNTKKLVQYLFSSLETSKKNIFWITLLSKPFLFQNY